MAISRLTPAILAGAIAAAIAAAPIAVADDNVDSEKAVASAEANRGPNKVEPKKRPAPNAATSDFNSPQIPQGWRNDALWGGAASNPFGKSAVRPPVIALD